jgi:hypothetical protein
LQRPDKSDLICWFQTEIAEEGYDVHRVKGLSGQP